MSPAEFRRARGQRDSSRRISANEQLLGIDVGTSSVKVLVCNADGSIAARSRISYEMTVSARGWAEQNPDDWWSATRLAISQVLQTQAVDPSNIVGVGLSGQMHGLVALGADGRPLRHAIIWPDRRTARECDRYREVMDEERIYELTGMRVVPGLFGPSLLWLQDNEPEIMRAAAAFVLPKDYVRLRLTGEIATDESDASGTLLFDVRKRQWASDLIGALELDSTMLPRVLSSTAPAGSVTSEAAEATGLRERTVVAAGGGDQAMGAVGVGAVKPGVVALTIGSGGQVIATVDTPITDRTGQTQLLCHAIDGKWIVMGATLTAGLALQWLEGILTREDSRAFDGAYRELMGEAESVPAGSHGLVFLPYLAGERTPHMNHQARACFTGLTLAHGRAEMVRAVMEGVSFSLNDALQALIDLGVPIRELVGSGGGAKSELWMRIQSSISRRPISISAVEEHSAYGAALTAGVTARVYDSLGEVEPRQVSVEPDPSDAAVYETAYSVFRQLYPALVTSFQQLGELS